MSISRAITQMIKVRSGIQKKLGAIDEEEVAVIESTKIKYKNRKGDLLSELQQTDSALKALGFTEEEIERLTKNHNAKD